MISRIAVFALFAVPALAQAQMVPAVHSSSGLKATAALSRIERDGPRIAAARYDALGIRATSGIELYPGLRQPTPEALMMKPRPATPGTPNDRPPTASKPPAIAGRSQPLIQRYKPPFVLTNANVNVPDVQDVIFFAETRVVRVRLHLKVAGEPIGKAWTKQLRRYFDFLDRDGDGMLNAFEADFVFSNRAIQQMLRSGNAVNNPAEPGRTLADFDIDGDGRISFDEFVSYYSQSAETLMRIHPSYNRDAFADTMTDEFFKLLDRDKDGKLSKAELADAEKLLPLLDQNEDECLAALEIVPNLFNRQAGVNTMVVITQNQNVPPVATDTLQIYPVGTIPETIVEQLLIRYDKSKKLRLSKKDSGFDDATFARLDKNGNGELSITELMAWKDLPPDVDIEMTLGSKQSECGIKLLPGPDGKPSPLAGGVKIGENGKAFVHVGKQQIDLGSVVSGDNNFQMANNFLNSFDQADPKNRGYIIEKDLVGPQFQFLRVIFDIVDRDGDGKMTKKEFTDYFALQESFAKLPLGLTHLTQTPSLFTLLDTNGDGRLSVRELRNAWNRLKDLEPGGGDITRAAMQPHATIRFGRSNQVFQAFGGGNYTATVPTLTKGPLWFRKMDRNGDGDVSRAEFPGRSEDFDKLDLDHDGLISLEEAEAADKRFRAEKERKKN